MHTVKGMLQLGIPICVLRPLRDREMFSANYVFLVASAIFSRRFLASIEHRVRTEGTAAIDKEAAPFLGNSIGTGLKARNFLCFLNGKNKSMKYICRKVFAIEHNVYSPRLMEVV